ncbi:HesA/MoeB/ThiF family protein [Desulfogranum japonicum]|uniref:HesA/MoeB/ThiF family protein n=1 Tax=Desulfogranum japonicum TaxID=231447 RepID=UPI0003FB9143|nr:ThiF family adenylyltransferase [Desulfogranum japonicum]
MISAKPNLNSFCVALAGLGGVGGICAQTLVDCRVGKLQAADCDVFGQINYPSQFFAIPQAIGQPKAEEVRRRLASNSHTEVQVFSGDLTLPENAEQLVQGADIVISALDNFQAQTAVALAAEQQAIPFAFISVVGCSCVYTIYTSGDHAFTAQWKKYGSEIQPSSLRSPGRDMERMMRRQQLIFSLAVGGFNRQGVETLYRAYREDTRFFYYNSIGTNLAGPSLALANIFNLLTGTGKAVLFPEIGIFNFHTCTVMQAETLMQTIYRLNSVFHKGVEALLEVVCEGNGLHSQKSSTEKR